MHVNDDEPTENNRKNVRQSRKTAHDFMQLAKKLLCNNTQICVRLEIWARE